MALGQNAIPDQNAVKTLTGVSYLDFKTVVPLVADPTTGRLLVDLQGGVFPSELGMEIPSGTVNGVNTVFTVQNTPIFVDTSGQVNVSSTQDATNYGFTLTGAGPYTMTFVNAPTQTPHSFYNYSGSGSSIASLFETDTFTSTLNQTVFTTTLTPVFVLSVVVNDQPQTLTLDYTQSGSTFTLNSGIPSGLKITITYIHN